MTKVELNNEIIQCRKTQLATLLTILGYEDGENKDNNTFFNLAKIGEFLESYKSFTSSEINSNTKTEQLLEEVKAQSKKYMEYLQERRKFIEEVRQVYEGFGIDLTNKILNKQESLDDLVNYNQAVKNVAQLFVGLNSDLFSHKQLKKFGSSYLVGLPAIEQEDCISALIDSKQFAEACNIEHSIFIDEVDNFETLLHSPQENCEEDKVYELNRRLLQERAKRAHQLEEYKVNYQNPNRVKKYPMDYDR